ncbi:7,8-dihydropterin-6-yl-methyl-4-(beta-D-ribofuranosyl)aminobenzene 5'-phosphate synthase [Anaerovirgula multivorans]|uniref:7,8-dihydropterin-6-yl-methyl-4-(Beta-D-ribofuranosyl)aminobenzene 5'-phosphate synthase n=1 Tax=Anaerovirgula multivorans TaxID=312168 RepID=A0A239B6I9_9FIRM|nr:MBL fold metallo-hydrolase [Anaerovirgula multivorans]SNS03446.1 7,8-dihydropterin-6-yl-methyl-4-(beta-D-ribofuranosyl)aminobenzene 5'-phosphate synthase [Anaerovirgula multivorans]
MILKVLVDNYTYIDEYYYGEPGVCYWIEVDGKKILFDLGYSDIFIKNAEKMGFSLLDVDTIVFSHGHNDHTWGIKHLFNLYSKYNINEEQLKKKKIIGHPLVFNQKKAEEGEIGFREVDKVILKNFHLHLSKEPIWITDSLVFLGEVERTNDFENKEPIGKTVIHGREEDDYLLDDSALVYKAEEGLVIITSCSHSGICNIVEYAKKICNHSKVLDIVGGFHLLNPDEQKLKRTLDYLENLGPRYIYAAHCTDFQSKLTIARLLHVKEVGVGLELRYDERDNIR